MFDIDKKYVDTTMVIENGEKLMREETRLWINYRLLDGSLHRSNGPARIWKKHGGEEYFLRGKRHRLDGLAINSGGVKEWWINNVEVTKDIKKWAKENGCNYNKFTDEELILIKLLWDG